MVDINVQKNQGLTFAIKDKLIADGHITKDTKISGSIWAQVMSEVSTYNAQQSESSKIYEQGNDISGSTKQNFVVKEGIIKFAQALWDKIVALVTGKSAQVNQSEQTNSINTQNNVNNIATMQVQPPQKFEQKITLAQNKIKEGLSGMTEQELAQIGISPAKRDRLLGYIQNIKYNANNYGSAQAMGSEIWINVNCPYETTEDFVKLLMHEANHCDENYLSQHPENSDANDLRHRDENGSPVLNPKINTVEEEKNSERLGLLTVAKLIEKGVLTNENYVLTGAPNGNTAGLSNLKVKDYLANPQALENDLDFWISQAYPGVVENLSGDVTIRHAGQTDGLEIKSGDVIKVNGQEIEIGKDGYYLSAIGRSSVCQVSKHDNNGNAQPVAGFIVLDGMEPTQDELAQLYEIFKNMPNSPIVKNGDVYELRTNNQSVQIMRDGQVIYEGKN